MSGIYLHIPFCKQACHYCDFHFSTDRSSVPDLTEAMVKELTNQKEYMNEQVSTIYFGGGTPSLLDKNHISLLLNTIYSNYQVAPDAEITLEANPDDLTKEKLIYLREAGVNRLIIGIHSFYDILL